MPKFSAFTPYGHLRFSSRPSHGEQIYRQMQRDLGDGENYSTEVGTLAEARVYCNAMAYARVRYALERAGSQFRPRKAVELLPLLEKEYSIVPGRKATITDRQDEVAAAAKTGLGARLSNVQAVLEELLGDDILGYRPVSTDELVVSSASPGNVGNWVKPGTLATLIRITSPISMVGSEVEFAYEYVSGSTEAIQVGQTMAVDIGFWGREERITITGKTSTKLKATFTYPHDAGTYATTGRAPNLSSNKRNNLVLLTSTVLRDPQIRRKVHLALRKLVRGVSIWTLTEEGDTPGSSGPFKVGVGKLGYTTIGQVAIP